GGEVKHLPWYSNQVGVFTELNKGRRGVIGCELMFRQAGSRVLMETDLFQVNGKRADGHLKADSISLLYGFSVPVYFSYRAGKFNFSAGIQGTLSTREVSHSFQEGYLEDKVLDGTKTVKSTIVKPEAGIRLGIGWQ